MKYLLSIIILLFLLVGTIYGLLFTAPGNQFLQPIIEQKIADQIALSTKLEHFLLRPDRFEVSLKIGDDTSIQTKGTIELGTQSIDATYDVAIHELSQLQTLIGQQLNGPFQTHGNIKGDLKIMTIDGVSDVAKSQTAYHLTLREFTPEALTAKIAHLHIDQLLYMLNQPIYTKGLVDIDANIPQLDMESLKGNIVTTLSQGMLQPTPIQKDFNISIPHNLTFNGDIQTRLIGTKAISHLDLTTSIANFQSKSLVYNLKEGSLSTDYDLQVPDLDKLYFITQQHMDGEVNLTGDVKVDQENIQINTHANIFGGVLEATYKKKLSKLYVKIQNIQTVALTDMLLYPHIFDSRANVTIDYNTDKEDGTLHAELLNGQILPNKMSFLLQQMANFDITKEIYQRTIIDTKIDKKVLHSDLYMKSRLTEINSTNGTIDLEDQTIDTTLNIKIRKNKLPVTLTGALTSPDIKIDTKALFKSKAKEELKKRLPENIKESPFGDLIKNFL
ncbi:MAG: hypothetical protein DSY46_03955 [Hydrogenimonas sp.]|nr:MAG: hypothetical protein DSY46_03955 [Hydrogenimonas sp.]